MDNLIASVKTTVHSYKGLLHIELLPYLNTAGTVLLGWIVVSWMRHIILLFLAPAAVSVLAVFLICPTTLNWLVKKLDPISEESVSSLMEKIGIPIEVMELIK